MHRPQPILFAHFGLDWITGSERCVLDLFEHLDRRAFKPVLVCNANSIADAARKLDVVVYCGSEFTPPDQFLPSRHLARRGNLIVKGERIRLIHASAFEHVKWLLPASRRARIPLLLHVHLPSSEMERCYSFSHQATRIIGSSHSAVAGFVKDGLDPARISVIYNAVDPERLAAGDASQLRQELGIGPRALVLGVLGSLIERKNQRTVIEALAILKRRGRTNVHLLLVGDGPDEQSLREIAAKLDVAEQTVFLGRRSDAVAIMRDAVDIAVTASVQEVFPLNVLEASYVGRPVVASDIAAHQEGIVQERTGLLVPTFSAQLFATALERLIDNADLRASMGAAAADRIRRGFLIDRYIQEFSDLYSRLIAAPPSTYGWRNGATWPRVYTQWLSRSIRLQGRVREPGQAVREQAGVLTHQ
jgi:glycosyltransferase involved in cell wall biosynthesis